MGTVNPLGKNVEEYWHGLIEGRSGASPIVRFPTDRLATKFACQVINFDPQEFLERKAAQRMAPPRGPRRCGTEGAGAGDGALRRATRAARGAAGEGRASAARGAPRGRGARPRPAGGAGRPRPRFQVRAAGRARIITARRL